MGTIIGVLFALALMAAPIVILLKLKQAGRQALEVIARRFGLEIESNSYATVAIGEIEGRRVWIQNHRSSRSWTAEVATQLNPKIVFSLLRKDWNRGWDERIGHGQKVELTDAQLAGNYILRSRTPEAAQALSSDERVCAELKAGSDLVYSLMPLEATPDSPYLPGGARGERLYGSLWYGVIGVPQPERVAAFVEALLAISRAVEEVRAL